jgi:hypothetical protein
VAAEPVCWLFAELSSPSSVGRRNSIFCQPARRQEAHRPLAAADSAISHPTAPGAGASQPFPRAPQVCSAGVKTTRAATLRRLSPTALITAASPAGATSATRSGACPGRNATAPFADRRAAAMTATARLACSAMPSFTPASNATEIRTARATGVVTTVSTASVSSACTTPTARTTQPAGTVGVTRHRDRRLRLNVI